MLWYVVALECAARLSGFSKPGTPTCQSLVPGFFHLFFGKLPYIAGLNFSCSIPYLARNLITVFVEALTGQIR